VARRREQATDVGEQRTLPLEFDGCPSEQLILGCGFGHVR
jgi:hypothetical protein